MILKLPKTAETLHKKAIFLLKPGKYVIKMRVNNKVALLLLLCCYCSSGNLARQPTCHELQENLAKNGTCVSKFYWKLRS